MEEGVAGTGLGAWDVSEWGSGLRQLQRAGAAWRWGRGWGAGDGISEARPEAGGGHGSSDGDRMQATGSLREGPARVAGRAQ